MCYTNCTCMESFHYLQKSGGTFLIQYVKTDNKKKSIVEKNKITSVGFNFPLYIQHFCLWVMKVWSANR
jgi:hypothetical protein